MDAIFFLRSYGDFMVALYALTNKKDGRFLNLYASQHLQPLYKALPHGLIPETTWNCVTTLRSGSRWCSLRVSARVLLIP